MTPTAIKARRPATTARAVPEFPVRARKLSHSVADALRLQISNGTLNAGDQLPSEAALLRLFGVSRPTLREALRVVESEGLIELGRGARTGATVLEPSIATAARNGELYLSARKTTLGEVHQVRMLLEPSLAGLLAQRPRRAAVEALRECLARERDALEAKDYAQAVTALNEFHRQMARHSENPALSLLAGILEGIPTKIYRQFLQAGGNTEQQAFKRRTVQSVAAHGKLVELIAGGDAAGAEKFWRNYMAETAEFLQRNRMSRLQVRPLSTPT